MKARIIYFLIIIAVFTQSAFPCTTFCLKHNHQMVFGYNYDFPVGFGFLVMNRRYLEKTAYLSQDEKPAYWISKYGSVTFNQAGMEFPMAGMNEKGLVIAQTMLPLTMYPDKDSRGAVSELQWIQYQLDNFESVEEVIASDSFVRVSNESIAPLHYFVADRFGRWAAIEFLNGKMVVHHDRNSIMPLLSNNMYEVSEDFLKHHVGFGGSEQIPTESIKELEEREDPLTSVNKACTIAANRLKYYNDSLSIIENAFEVLQRVAKQRYTQWSIVFSITDMNICFRISRNEEIRHVDFKDFSLDCNSKVSLLDIQTSTATDILKQFQAYSTELNRGYINKMNKALTDMKVFSVEPTKEQTARQAEYPEKIKCGETKR